MKNTLRGVSPLASKTICCCRPSNGPAASAAAFSDSPGRRFFTSQIVDRLHAQFDPGGKSLVTYYGDAANNQIFLDPARLEALKISPAQIARWLETEDYLAAAFTEDDVRAAQRRLPAPRR